MLTTSEDGYGSSKTGASGCHNTWVFNKPSTLVVIPVGDLSQHVLLNICYMLQNGLVLYDDINKRYLPGIDQFSDIVDVANVWAITFVEQWSLSEQTVELGISCYAGALMLQAMGLGGGCLTDARRWTQTNTGD